MNIMAKINETVKLEIPSEKVHHQSPFYRLWLLPGFPCSLDGEAKGFRVWPHVYDIHRNNFGFCFPGDPSPTTLRVCPNSNLWLCGLSIHMPHSGSSWPHTKMFSLDFFVWNPEPGEFGSFGLLYLHNWGKLKLFANWICNLRKIICRYCEIIQIHLSKTKKYKTRKALISP